MKYLEPRSGNGIIDGIILVLVGLVILAANIYWLYTGDVREPQYNFQMKGGWLGFWLSSAAGVLLLGLGFYFLFGCRPGDSDPADQSNLKQK